MGIMRKILAVSGGVDSMVMLDLIVKAERTKKKADSDEKFREKYSSDEIKAGDDYSYGEIIVAHFDHRMRENSGEDAEFVRKISEEIYHEMNITGKGEFKGEGIEGAPEKIVSEEAAREARYNFLHGVAEKNEPAMIYTAHHLDDLIETVAINLLRGTGWRGLAVLDAPGVRRPLLEAEICYEPMDKLAILEYAAKRGLRFREDQTNGSEQYLRNRVRARLMEENWSYERKLEMWELWRKQKKLKREIDQLVTELLPKEGEAWQRKWFWEMEKWAEDVESARGAGDGVGSRSEPGKAESMRIAARELLRAGLLRAGVRATRPQIEEFRQAVLTYKSGKYFNLPGDRLVKIGKDEFKL